MAIVKLRALGEREVSACALSNGLERERRRKRREVSGTSAVAHNAAHLKTNISLLCLQMEIAYVYQTVEDVFLNK